MKLFSLTLVCLVIISGTTAHYSQCRYKIVSENTEEKATHPNVPRNSVFTLKKDSSFKISLDSPLTSDYERTGDHVSFSVLDEVYVEETKVFSGKEYQTECLFIPKATKVYGRVEHVNPRTPFNIRGKADVYVFVDSIRVGGADIPIRFVVKPAPVMSKSKVIVKCKHNENNPCVAGRRSRGNIPNDFGKVGADYVLNQENDDFNTTELIASTVGGILSSAGSGALINRPNATIKAGHIFDVEVTKEVSLWFKMPYPDK